MIRVTGTMMRHLKDVCTAFRPRFRSEDRLPAHGRPSAMLKVTTEEHANISGGHPQHNRRSVRCEGNGTSLPFALLWQGQYTGNFMKRQRASSIGRAQRPDFSVESADHTLTRE